MGSHKSQELRNEVEVFGPKKTWLIQRLRDPIGRSNPFSFGCVRNGGLSDEAMKLLNGAFLFDYMGRAEFEWGAVPEALSYIHDYSKKGKARTGIVNLKVARKKRQVYYLCADHQKEYVVEKIKELAKKDEKLCEPTLLRGALSSPGNDIRGWLELDNGFFFFADKQMYEKVCKLFNAKPAFEAKIAD